VKALAHKPAAWQRACAVVSLLLLPWQPAFGGGPVTVGGPTAGVSGIPLAWDSTKPITYRVDAGPLSQRPDGTVVMDNAAGVSRVNRLFGNWSAVATANLTFSNAGGLLGIANAGFPAGGDVQTAQQFLNVLGDPSVQATPDPNSCYGGGQSPIMFDANGSMFASLGLPPEVIGFAFQCAFNQATGKVISAGAVLNGRFQDGISDLASSNPELTAAEFDQAFTHEFGHFLGLDHSQINVDLFMKAINGTSYSCTPDDTAGMPLMFPIIGICPAKPTAGVPMIAVDDAAWISKLYPVASPAPSGKTSFNSAYGILSGTIFFSDGVTPAQGVNVIARSTNLPRRNTASAISGFLFTGNPGQTATCTDPANPTPATCSNLGSRFGSRDPALVGHYEIPLPTGTYTVTTESIYGGFSGGSGMGPLDPPIPSPGTSTQVTITVTAGATTPLNITLKGTLPRFDVFENALLIAPAMPAIPVASDEKNKRRRNS
jgi:hypothetical protein